MRMFGSYIIFFIFMMRMTLVDSNDKYQQFYQEMLKVHNEYRAKHSAGSLTLDTKLSEDAMKIAKAEDEGQLFSCHDESIGYNVLYEYPTNILNARMVFNAWYEEGKNYSYEDDTYMREITSSFTQIVWKSTEKLGVAVYPGTAFVIIVTTYSPRGNIGNEYMNNVVAIAIAEDDSSSTSAIKRQRTVY